MLEISPNAPHLKPHHHRHFGSHLYKLFTRFNLLVPQSLVQHLSYTNEIKAFIHRSYLKLRFDIQDVDFNEICGEAISIVE